MPFVKGDPNINRNGRPKGISITEMVRKKLGEVSDEKDRATYGDKIVEAILKKATKENDVQMLKAVWAYMDGQPKQEIKQSIEVMVDKDTTDEELDKLING